MKRKILFAFAHPDDETFTVGGLLATLAKRSDVETIIYTATLGDAGKCGNPPVCSKEELPRVRKQELMTAASILGVDRVITGTYLDGTLGKIDENALVQTVRNLISTYQPSVVVTFPPHGISGHEDHKAIQKATYRAVAEDKNSPVEKLYYVTAINNRPHAPAYTNSLDEIDAIHCFGDEEAKKVQQALQAHRTQHLSVERVFPDVYNECFKKFDNCEYFILAWKKNEAVNIKVVI
jgi:N-acetylglucosamine malate deacetylase 2